MPNPLNRKKPSGGQSIYANTGTPNGETQKEKEIEMQTTEIQEEQKEESGESVPPPVISSTPEQRITVVELPPGPQVRRRRHKGLKFSDIYETRSLSIDKRLLPAFDDFMESGETKTALANQLVLKILLEAGYTLDPDILKKPIIKPQ